MSSAYEYKFEEYPNVKVIVYEGVNKDCETDLDKIITDITLGINQYGFTTIHLTTVDKYVEISGFSEWDNGDEWFGVNVLSLDDSEKPYHIDILIKREKDMDKLIYLPLKYEYECVIIPYEFYTTQEK